MSTFMKKILWPYYGITFFIMAVILFWGLSGVLGGGGHTYRVFIFYAIIPGITGVVGVILGLKNACMKWFYPVLSGIFAFLIYYVVFQHAFTILPGYAYFFVPFLPALIGLGIGVFIWNINPRYTMRLKGVIKMLLIIGFVVILIHVIHALTLDRIIEYKEVAFYSPNVSSDLDGYRIAFIADTHSISEERLWSIVNELNQKELDLVIHGGDFSPFIDKMQRTVEILSHIETADGIFGVEGNHDRHVTLFATMRAHGMTPLSNSGLSIRENFFLAGVEDLWNRNPSISEALVGSKPEDFVLLIAHNPDITMQQNTTGVDLILSGHTHGGQITFFGIWAPYLTFRSSITDYGQRFRAGWSLSQDGTPVFVSRGTGEYLPRVFARPQVILVTLFRE